MAGASNEFAERTRMKRIYIASVLAVVMLTFAHAQTPEGQSIDQLVSAAKAAAGTEWTGTFARLCVPPPAGGRGGGGGGANNPPPRSAWYAEPAKVADNLYFIGTKVHHAWALVG